MSAIPAIVHLDKKLSAASCAGRGANLSAADLDLLATLGLFDIVQRAKSTYLQEQARCRDARLRSIDGGNTGSGGTRKPTAIADRPSSPSSGTTPPPDASEAHRRANRPRQKP